MKNLLPFVEKNMEWMALSACALCLPALYVGFAPAQGMTVVLFCTLALYYLASGVLVLLDRQNIEKVMRLIWFLGLWGLSLLVLGAMSKLLFWTSAPMTLLAGGASALAVCAFLLLNRMGLSGELLQAFIRENRPLLRRLVIGLMLSSALYFSSNRVLYSYFGSNRDDPEYVQVLMDYLDHPDDKRAKERWEEQQGNSK